MVNKTNNVVDCAKTCVARKLCRHYIWHKSLTSKRFECWVVESEEDGKENVSRHFNYGTWSGSCRKGIKREREKVKKL